MQYNLSRLHHIERATQTTQATQTSDQDEEGRAVRLRIAFIVLMGSSSHNIHVTFNSLI